MPFLLLRLALVMALLLPLWPVFAQQTSSPITVKDVQKICLGYFDGQPKRPSEKFKQGRIV